LKEKVQVIITAATPQPDPFLEAGFPKSKNLVNFRDQTILKKIVSIYDEPSLDIRVAVLQTELSKFVEIGDFSSFENAPTIIPITTQTLGALCTALLSIDYERRNTPLVIAPGDSVTLTKTNEAIATFTKNDVEVGTIVFPSDELNRSYVRIGTNEKILEIAERRVISNYATTGLFYFKNVDLFLEGAEWALTNSINFKNQYYVSHSIHKLLADGKTTQVYKLDQPDDYLSLRNPAEVIKRLEKYD